MNTETQVREAFSIQEALIAIAARLDELNPPEPSGPPADAWSQWDDPVAHEKAAANLNYREEVLAPDLGDRPEDPDDAKAWEARKRLAEDVNVEEVDHNLDAGMMPTVDWEEGADAVVENIPSPNEEQRTARRNFLQSYDDPKFRGEWGELFEEVGPWGVYAADREFVLQLPTAWKKRWVEDVEMHSPRAAHEMGRDILMVRKSGDDVDPIAEANAATN